MFKRDFLLRHFHAKKSLFFPVNLLLQMSDNLLHVTRIHPRSPQRVAGITADAFPLLVRAEKHVLHEQTERRICVEPLFRFRQKRFQVLYQLLCP